MVDDLIDDPTPDEQQLEDALRAWAAAWPVSEELAEALLEETGDVLSPGIARTMVAPLQRALQQQDHPFPSFASLLMSLRGATKDEASRSRRLSVPTTVLERFERGEIHPSWFPRTAAIAAARLLPPESNWKAALIASLAESPEVRAPAPDESWLRQDPWGSVAQEAQVAEVERVPEVPPAIIEPNSRVRWTANDEVGLVLRHLGGELYEVSLPSGVRYVPLAELDLGEGSLRDRLLTKGVGRLPLLEQRLRALYLEYAFRFDELAGLSNARIEPKPHQVFVAWRVLQKVRPRMIIADEVGLGKTIEAGMIIAELRARGLADRVLIMVPASLVSQWVWELQSKFNVSADVYDGARLKELRRRHPDRNVWELNDTIICSLPLATREPNASEILEADWDVVVFDEAHKVRRQRGRATKAYLLAENMRFDTYGMLLLTATPMQLDSYELFSLIEIIEPGLFSGGEREFEDKRRNVPQLNKLWSLLEDFGGLSAEAQVTRCDDLSNAIARYLQIEGPPKKQAKVLSDESKRTAAQERLQHEHPLVEVMVRNRKIDIPESFAQRDVTSTPVPMSALEEEIYDRVSQYVREGFNRARETKNMTAGFLMVAFQKMLTSSSHSLSVSFQKRIHRLQAIAAKERESASALVEAPVAVGTGRGKAWQPMRREWEDVEEESSAIDEALTRILNDESQRVEAAIRAEVDELASLVELLNRNHDSKLTALMGFLSDTLSDETEKVIIFTQFVETQLFLRDALASKYRVQIFNGRQSAEEKDRSVQRFRAADQILISTEAGGEGRNFQFAHVVVNYDLPWNPMKIEQRIGRIDRIGQDRTVVIRNLYLTNERGDSLDERVLSVLRDRINVFEESIGSLDPILGDIEDEIRRVALEVDREQQRHAFQILGEEIEQKVYQARRMSQIVDEDFIMRRNSLRLDKADDLLGRHHLADPEDLERFVADFLTFNGGSIDEHAKGGDVISMPPPLAHELRARESRIRGTFDVEMARELEEISFFAIGHPFVNRVVQVAEESRPEALIAALEELGTEDRWLLEIWYRVDISGVRPDQQFRIHRTSAHGLLESRTANAMPSFVKELRSSEVAMEADDIQRALEHSEVALGAELAELRSSRAKENELRFEREMARLERVSGYRREKELHTIRTQKERLERIEAEGSQDERRLIPALRGRINKAQERLQRVELEVREERAQIESRARLGLSFELVAAIFVHEKAEP